MSIKESALTAITSIAQSDFVRAVTSAGASRRITVSNLAKAIVESYTGSSLAGSSQSIKSAVDSINSNLGTITNQTSITTTIPSAAKTQSCSISLGAGVYVITFLAGLNVASGTQVQITITQGTTDIVAPQIFIGSTGLHKLEAVAIININATTTIYGTVYQNSGSSITMSTNIMKAVKIRG